MDSSDGHPEEIAIVGLAGRFPGAADVDAFWRNLRDGVESIRSFTADELRAAGVSDDEASSSGYVNAGAVLDEADGFDAAFFGFSKREAELMDPQHRALLECSWTALEHAGYDPGTYPGLIGVFGGVAPNTYFQHVLMTRPDILSMAGRYPTLISSEREYAVTRVAFKLDLKGPAISVNTACSTSGVALHLACQSVLSGECDMALVGGARIKAPLTAGYHYEQDGILSPDGHCRAFDERARGTVVGSGVVTIVIKRLSDALRDGDTVHAVIKGTAVSNDGADKVGFTAPSVDGQASAVSEALEMAGVSADSVDYVEAHGTGTFLGDPIEVAALTSAFRRDTDRTGFCRIGSVKTNIGHLDAGAGLAGVVKTVLALQHGQLPPSLHFSNPNSQIDFASSPFVVNDTLCDWPATDTPRRAGVSTFGLGGTNAHIVLEQAPSPSATPRPEAAPHLVALSARTPSALDRATGDLAEHLAAGSAPHLADVAHTLAVGRRPLPHRRITVAADAAEAGAALAAADPRRVISGIAAAGAVPPVFMFPGGGAQYAGMGRDLYRRFPVFRQWIDRSADILSTRLPTDLRDILWPGDDADPLERPALALPALVAVEYAMARLLQSLGLHPEAVIGHSVGEYAAACVAGVLGLEDALQLVTLRGELFEQLPDGAMLSVPLSEEELADELGDDLSIAVINRADLSIVSGAVDAVDRLERTLADRGIDSTRLHIAVAAHSPMVEPILEPFEKFARTIAFSPPAIPLASNLTGTWLSDEDATDPGYWVRHLRHTVRFVDGLSTFLGVPDCAAVEVGPGRTLSGLARQHPARPSGQTVVATIRHPNEARSDDAFLLEAIGRLWVAGTGIELSRLTGDEPRRRVPLPTYPFERERYWIAAGQRPPTPAADQAHVVSDAPAAPAAAAPSVDPATAPPPDTAPLDRRSRILAELMSIFHELTGMDPDDLDAQATFLELGFDSLFMTQATGAVGARFDLRISFRQLFEEAPTIAALADHIDQRLADDAFPPPAAPVAPPHALQPAPTPALDAPGAPGDTVQHVIDQQLEIMRRQLAVLAGSDTATGAATQAPSPQGVDTADPMAAPPAGASAATTPADAADAPATIDAPATSNGTGAVDRDGRAQSASHGPWRPIERAADGLSAAQRAHIDALTARLATRGAGSKARTQAARQRLADPRTVAGFRRAWKELVFPVVATRSEGSRIWDVDGNEFIDIAMGFGVNLFGHSPRFVIDAVTEQIAHGIEIGPQTPLAAEVAELIGRLTGHERVAFCNTGSEAVLAAMRLARTVTGRTKIVTFSGDYHGLFDEVLVRGLGTGGARRSMPIAPGIPPHMTQDMIVLDYGDDASLQEIRAHADELAAVLVEPVQSRHPDLQPGRFLRDLRALTTERGVPLIFDEMITGFRSHPGGAQALFGVEADLATYGKVVGGGFPIGVVAGRGAYMDALDGGWWQYGDDSVPEADVTWFAGTFVRHPVALAAARATLRHLLDAGPQLQADLNARTGALVADLNGFLTDRGAPVHVEQFSSLFLTRFTGAQQFSSLFYFHLRDHGIHVTEGRAAFLSTAHSDDDLATIADAYKRSIVDMQDAGLLPRDPAAVHAQATARSDAPVPLTVGQEEIWLASQISAENNCAYNLSNTLRLRGALDPDALRTALQSLVDRHEALRTTIAPDGTGQRVATDVMLDVAEADLSTLPDDEREARLERLRAAEVETPFDLSDGPLVRVSLLRLADDDHLLFLTVHHIVCDGWSAGVLFRDLSVLYNRARGVDAAALDAPMQLREYARWHDGLNGSEQWDESLRHWTTALSGPLPATELPTDRPRAVRRTLAATRRELQLDGELVSRLRAQSSEQGRTLFTTLLAGFQCLLQRTTRSEDVVVGVSIAGQTQFPDRDLVGHCINMLPLRATVAPDETFSTRARSTHLDVLDAVDHQQVSYGALVKALRPRRDPSRPALVSVVFNMDSPFAGLDFGDVEAEPGSNPRHFENFDVFVNLVPSGDGLTVECTYNVDLYDDDTIRRRLEEYEQLLRGVADDPDIAVSDLPLLSSGERGVLAGFNATGVDYPDDATLVGLFDAQVAATPDATAVVDHDGATLSYAQLAARVNRLAWWLRDTGVTTGTLVGVFMTRSSDLVVALHAIVAAGGAYVPLDPDYPADRLRFMIDEAAMPVVLTQGHLRDALSGLTADAGLDPTIAAVDTDRDALTRDRPDTAPPVTVAPDDLAYVIYTSGSTGRPKGVANTHRGIANRLLWMQDRYQLDTDDRVLQKTPFSFDVSVWEFFWPLQVGARLVVAAPDGHRDAGYLIEVIARHTITTIHFVPSMLRLFLDHPDAAAATSLRRVICSGEALTADLRDRFFDRLSCELHNLYGPTEAAVDVTAWQCRPDHDTAIVPIGRPIANTTIHILDDHGHPTPIGVPGELHIGGVQVARGYIARPDLTRERFIDDPFDPDPAARLYKTGDLARWLPDGTIDFLGRLDFQVKLHGVRIELGEIEAALGTHPNIRDATVILHTDQRDQRLFAYLVTDGTRPTSKQLRSHLADRLPSSMIPSGFMILDALPLTASGKVDRNALPEPDRAQRDTSHDHVAPTTTLEREIADIWTDVLGTDRIGIHDDFFDLGGHSLKALQTFARIRDDYGVELPMALFFEAPTVAGQVQAVADALTAAEDDEALLALIDEMQMEEAGEGGAP